MENLQISEQGPPQPQQQQPVLGRAAAQGQAQGGPTQLPPQMFTTAAQLLDLTDSKRAVPHAQREQD